MPTGSCGRFLFGRFATPSARTKPPGRAAQKLVRRPNKRTRQRASESTDLRTALPVTEKHSASSWTRPPRREADPAAGRELLGATRATRARGATLPQQKSVHRRRRRFRAATRAVATSKSGRDAVAAPRRHDQHPRSRGSASAESARYHKKMSNSSLDAPAGRRSAAGRCSRHDKMYVGPAVRRHGRRGHGPELLRVPDVRGPRRARLAPQRPSGRTTGRSGRRRRDVQSYCITAFGSRLRACRRRRARCVA